jgi:Flp pilus assembly protein TadD
MSLATNWYALGVRSSKDEYRRKSLEQLKAMSEEPEAIAEVIAGYGVTAYQFGDLDTAEAQYRKALKVNPQLQIATNNLALLIADRGGDLAEALSLARSSVEANPSVATYYDTLAHVNVARKEFDEAIANLRKAVELEPESPDWRINLAKAYMDKGDRQGAKDALLEFESLRIPSDRLTAELQERLKLVRSFAFEQAEAGVNAQ